MTQVLAIEDDARLAEMLGRFLAEHGVRLTHASDASTGLDLALGGAFDAVLLDVMLPDGGVGLGLALVREIARAHGGDARRTARPGGGRVFEVELAAYPSAPKNARSSESSSSGTSSAGK